MFVCSIKFSQFFIFVFKNKMSTDPSTIEEQTALLSVQSAENVEQQMDIAENNEETSEEKQIEEDADSYVVKTTHRGDEEILEGATIGETDNHYSSSDDEVDKILSSIQSIEIIHFFYYVRKTELLFILLNHQERKERLEVLPNYFLKEV